MINGIQNISYTQPKAAFRGHLAYKQNAKETGTKEQAAGQNFDTFKLASPAFKGNKGRVAAGAAALALTLGLLAGCSTQKPQSSKDCSSQAATSSGPVIHPKEDDIRPSVSDNTSKDTAKQDDSEPKTETQRRLEECANAINTIQRFIDQSNDKIDAINSEIEDITAEISAKNEELQEAENLLTSFDRTSPDDTPPGWTRAYNNYLGILAEIQNLENSLEAKNEELSKETTFKEQFEADLSAAEMERYIISLDDVEGMEERNGTPPRP